jgi:hypothetical protein
MIIVRLLIPDKFLGIGSFVLGVIGIFLGALIIYLKARGNT